MDKFLQERIFGSPANFLSNQKIGGIKELHREFTG